MGTCGTGRRWAGFIYLTHKSHFEQFELQNSLNRAGDNGLESSEQDNNQLQGSNFLRETWCMLEASIIECKSIAERPLKILHHVINSLILILFFIYKKSRHSLMLRMQQELRAYSSPSPPCRWSPPELSGPPYFSSWNLLWLLLNMPLHRASRDSSTLNCLCSSLGNIIMTLLSNAGIFLEWSLVRVLRRCLRKITTFGNELSYWE